MKTNGYGYRPIKTQTPLTMTHDTLVVARHPSFVDFLREKGIIDDKALILTHVLPSMLVGKRVVSYVPLYQAALCYSVVECMFQFPDAIAKEQAQTNRFYTLEEFHKYTTGIYEYKVIKMLEATQCAHNTRTSSQPFDSSRLIPVRT